MNILKLLKDSPTIVDQSMMKMKTMNINNPPNVPYVIRNLVPTEAWNFIQKGSCYLQTTKLLPWISRNYFSRVHKTEVKCEEVTLSDSCGDCGKYFPKNDDDDFANKSFHRKIIHLGYQFPCPLCGKVFSTRLTLNKHVLENHKSSDLLIVVGRKGNN